MLKNQAREASADHLAKCCAWNQGRRHKANTLTELSVKGDFTENREEYGTRNCRGIVKKYTLIRIETKEVDLYLNR